MFYYNVLYSNNDDDDDDNDGNDGDDDDDGIWHNLMLLRHKKINEYQ